MSAPVLTENPDLIKNPPKPLKIGNVILARTMSSREHEKSAYILETKHDYSKILAAQNNHMIYHMVND